jgi:hypothetical protein
MLDYPLALGNSVVVKYGLSSSRADFINYARIIQVVNNNRGLALG